MDLAAAELLLALRTRVAAAEARLDRHETRMDDMAERTEAGFAALTSAISEVAGEMETLARGDGIADARTGDRLLAMAAQLRGLRPDASDPTDPAPPPVTPVTPAPPAPADPPPVAPTTT